MWPTAKTATWGMTEHGPGQMRWVGMYATLRNKKLQPILKLCRKEWKWDWLSTTIAGLWPVRTGLTQRSAELVLPFCGATTCQPKSGSDSLNIPSLKKTLHGCVWKWSIPPKRHLFFFAGNWWLTSRFMGVQARSARGPTQGLSWDSSATSNGSQRQVGWVDFPLVNQHIYGTWNI